MPVVDIYANSQSIPLSFPPDCCARSLDSNVDTDGASVARWMDGRMDGRTY